jgi:hypothetical protein
MIDDATTTPSVHLLALTSGMLGQGALAKLASRHLHDVPQHPSPELIGRQDKQARRPLD